MKTRDGNIDFLRSAFFLVCRVCRKVVTFLYCCTLPVKWNPTWKFYSRPWIIKSKGSRIDIGDGFVAVSTPARNVLCLIQRVFLRTWTPCSEIMIGNNVGVSGCTIASAKSIRIGNNVMIGSGALITDSDVHSLCAVERLCGGKGAISAPIVIGDNVFIGARAIILKGVTIGAGAVVGAGAIVAKDVPEYSIVAGNPARVIRMLDREGEIKC